MPRISSHRRKNHERFSHVHRSRTWSARLRIRARSLVQDVRKMTHGSADLSSLIDHCQNDCLSEFSPKLVAKLHHLTSHRMDFNERVRELVINLFYHTSFCVPCAPNPTRNAFQFNSTRGVPVTRCCSSACSRKGKGVGRRLAHGTCILCACSFRAGHTDTKPWGVEGLETRPRINSRTGAAVLVAQKGIGRWGRVEREGGHGVAGRLAVLKIYSFRP